MVLVFEAPIDFQWSVSPGEKCRVGLPLGHLPSEEQDAEQELQRQEDAQTEGSDGAVSAGAGSQLSSGHLSLHSHAQPVPPYHKPPAAFSRVQGGSAKVPVPMYVQEDLVAEETLAVLRQCRFHRGCALGTACGGGGSGSNRVRLLTPSEAESAARPRAYSAYAILEGEGEADGLGHRLGAAYHAAAEEAAFLFAAEEAAGYRSRSSTSTGADAAATFQFRPRRHPASRSVSSEQQPPSVLHMTVGLQARPEAAGDAAEDDDDDWHSCVSTELALPPTVVQSLKAQHRKSESAAPSAASVVTLQESKLAGRGFSSSMPSLPTDVDMCTLSYATQLLHAGV